MSRSAPGHAAGTILHVETLPLVTTRGPFDVHVYRNLATGGYALAVVRGDLGGATPVLARVHSSCVTSEALGSCDCDCVEQLDAALAAIARAGRGVLFYLMQEGRGAGFTAKVRDRMIVQASGERTTTFEAYRQMGLAHDYRSYDEVAFVLASLGIAAPLTLLTGNPDKVADLERAGVAVAETTSSAHAASPFNSHYLRAKRRAQAPLAGAVETPAARLPERVTYFEPFVPEGMPELVSTASYLLPIAPPLDGTGARAEVQWFRLHAYFDLQANHERVVLTYGAPAHGACLVRVQETPLLERFPLVGGAGAKRRWQETVRAFVRHGAGCAILRVDERSALVPPPARHPATVARLLAHHVRGSTARPVLDGPAGHGDVELARALAADRITLEPPLLLGDVDAD